MILFNSFLFSIYWFLVYFVLEPQILFWCVFVSSEHFLSFGMPFSFFFNFFFSVCFFVFECQMLYWEMKNKQISFYWALNFWSEAEGRRYWAMGGEEQVFPKLHLFFPCISDRLSVDPWWYNQESNADLAHCC